MCVLRCICSRREHPNANGKASVDCNKKAPNGQTKRTLHQRVLFQTRLAASVRPIRHDPTELGPTESCTWCSWSLLSFGCDSSGYYRVAHGTGLSPNETQSPCRTLVACLFQKYAERAAMAWASHVARRPCAAPPLADPATLNALTPATLPRGGPAPRLPAPPPVRRRRGNGWRSVAP